MLNDEEEFLGEQENPEGLSVQQEMLQETIAPAQAEGGEQQ